MDEIKHAEMLAHINRLIGHNQSALSFIKLHNDFVHAVDDVVDENWTPEKKCEAFLKVWEYYNHPYYVSHPELKIVGMLNHIDYQNSVRWEKHEDKVLRDAANILRHASIQMLYAVVAIECGVADANAIAADFREYTIRKHSNDFQ